MLDAAERAVRTPGGRSALVLHLSRMVPPAPRPHHRRIARALLDDAAGRGSGQVFALRNTDLVLLRAGGDAGLWETLARLFRIDVPDPSRLLSDWCAAADGPALLAYAAARVADTHLAPDVPDPVASAGTADALDTLVGQSRISDLTQQQTAVLLHGAQMRPLFREVTFSLAVLEARVAAVGQANADPWLFRHLATRLDTRMLDAWRQDVRGGALPLHLNLTVAGILSEPFAGFAAACRAAGAAVGVEVPLVEACADPEAFTLARDRLRLAGMAFVLDGVSHHALLLTVPAALAPDLVKLDWHPTVPEGARALDEAVAALGPGRVVLHRAETEAALAWGMARGIRRFQGRHVDAMLAAQRIGACAHGRACTLRQCTERATATGPGGRAGCFNPALLDAAAP